MSVLKNKRSESQLEFYHTATELRTELTRFVMNENNVPKRWRPVFTFPMIDKLHALFDHITAANTIYPTCMREYDMRRDHQTAAIITVEQIIQLLQYMLMTLSLNADKLKTATELAVKEGALLRGWRKADNKLKEKFE